MSASAVGFHNENDSDRNHHGVAAFRERRDRLVLEHLAMVRPIALHVHAGLPAHAELEDLLHAGILGLLDAAGKYDPTRQPDFRTYAKHRIRGAILDSLRQLDWASRVLRSQKKSIDAARQSLSSELGRSPTDDEIGARTGISLNRVREALRINCAAPVSLSPSPDESVKPLEFPAPAQDRPDAICAGRELRQKVRDAMKDLPSRYQKVLELYYMEELTMRQIGSIIGVNESRVSQIHATAIAKMGSSLHELGIRSSREVSC